MNEQQPTAPCAMPTANKKSSKDETQQSFFESLYAALDADANEIADGLFLGAAKAASDKAAMKKRRISHVLIAHPTFPEKHPSHFRYGRAPLVDLPNFNLLELIPDALAFFREARSKGGKVFCYCAKGISRSSSLVIALLMLEQGLTFEEAWSMCERKRPIVYPNVGFQQQLRYLEKTMAKVVDFKAPWVQQIKALREALPKGDLEGPGSPLPIRDAIGSCMGAALNELEGLVEKVLAQPQLLQKRELWKRQGLFFENLHKYKAIPADLALLGRAKTAADQLRSLQRVYSQSLKGVQLANAVAQELEDWSRVAAPELQKLDAAGEAKAPVVEEKPAKELSKKEKKKLKKERKREKKARKDAKKAEKALAKIEKAAQEAENVVKRSTEEEAQAAKQIAEITAEIEAAEAAAAEAAESSSEDAEMVAKAQRLRAQLNEAYEISAQAALAAAQKAEAAVASVSRKRKKSSSSSDSSDS